MLRLRMWARIGLVALVLAAASAWVTVSVTPSYAITSGTKTLDPGATDPGGGTPTAGDPDGPTGDVAPAGGPVSGGGSLSSGAFTTAVQNPTVGAAAASPTQSLWMRFWIAIQMWLWSDLWRL